MVAVIAVIAGFLTYLSRDIPPFDDSDMAVSPIILKDEENAYFDLLEIEKTIYYPEEKKELITKMANGEEWDQSFADELIAKNAEALKSFRNMLTRKGYQDPAVQVSEKEFSPSMILGPVGNIRTIAYISLIQARTYLGQGSIIEAQKVTLDCGKVAMLLQNSPRSHLLGYLVGFAIKKSALLLLGDISRQYPAPLSEDLMDSLKSLERNSFSIQESFRMEYQIGRNLLKNLDASLFGEISGENVNSLYFHFLFKPNETLGYFYDLNRSMVFMAEGECGDASIVVPKYSWNKEDRNGLEKVSLVVTENAVGKVLYSVVAVSLGSVHEKRCEDSFLVFQTQLSLAVNAHKAEHGSYPKSLDELAPKYMKTVPTEFAGRPLEYDAMTGRVAEMKDFYPSE